MVYSARVSRSSRLFKLAELLRACESTSIDRLAGELGVSGRTVRRDLSALREAGHAITSEPGRGGGVRLEQRTGLASVQLSIDEAAWTWLGGALAERLGSLPFSRSARSAARKLLASLPITRRRQLLDFGRRIVLGPPPTAAMAQSAQPFSPAALPLIERAFTERLGLSFDYQSARGTVTARRAQAHGLLVQAPLWYLLGFDLDRQAARMFRIDRLRQPTLLDGAPFSPRPELLGELLPNASSWPRLVER